MASILVVGPDTALLEGVAQTLIASGHETVAARDIPEALEMLRGVKPLVAIVQCEELLLRGSMLHSALAPGGAVMAFHCDDDDDAGLPFSVKRATLAELRLPLERQRLLALVKYVAERAHAAGKDSVDEDSSQPEIRPG